jgi:hypothetical protein
MARQIIKLGEIVKSAWSKANANFEELYNMFASIDLSIYAKKSDIASAYSYKGTKATYAELPTSDNAVGDVWNVEENGGMNYAWTGTAWDALGATIDLSGYATVEAMNAGLSGKVSVVDGKGLSTNDYTTAEKEKLAGLSAPSELAFTAANWGTAAADGYYTYAITSNRHPVKVMKKNGTTYEEVIIQANTTDTSIVLISEEAFEGYVLTV